MGIKLPKLKIGRFLRTEVAPLIPGGQKFAESANTIVKAVKGQTSEGATVLQATRSAVEDVNRQEQMRQWLTFALIGAGLLFLVVRARR